MPYKKQTIEVKVPKMSGCDMSHRNSGSETCGTLQPLLVEEVIPKTRCSLKLNIVTQLPPLISDTYMNVQKRVEAFFIPMRLCCASFEDFFCDFPRRVSTYSSSSSVAGTLTDVKAALPVFRLDSSLGVGSNVFGRGTLLDYLGFKIKAINTSVDINPLSLIAYHLVWQEYYRNPKVQNPAFAPDLGLETTKDASDRYRVVSLPYKYFHRAFTGATQGGSTSYADNTVIDVSTTSLGYGSFSLADGVNIFSLRQRNFGYDFFTSCRPSAQQGNAASVTLALPAGATDTSFTIAQLRAANSLQMFRERNNAPSPRLVDQVKARYGANLSDGVAQRPICIGSAVYDVITRGVDQTAVAAAGSAMDNPFNSVASQYGRAYGVGSDFIIDDFTANEPGFILVLQSLVPVVTYSSGIAPYLRRYLSDGSIVEMANPLLQNIGDEPVFTSQLKDSMLSASDLNTVFGYADRYGTFMFHPSEVHSQLADGETLDGFVLQRSFGSAPTLGSSFLEIPTNYLDPVFSAASGVTGLSAWYDAKLDWKISVPLAEFSIPSLQDPAYEHGDSVYLRRNGQIF